MQELRYVGPGEDAEHVRVETVDGLEQFTLLVTDELREATRALPARANSDLSSATVSPREIQIRVRAGQSPEEVADAAGIEVEKVLVFAGPVLAERARMADEARRARARRSTAEAQVVFFGEAVDQRFSAHGLDPAEVNWDAHRRDDGQWVIVARWIGGDTQRAAQWAFTRSARMVTPLDETAADLLSDRPIRPVVSVVPDLQSDSAAVATTESPTGPLPTLEHDLPQDAPASQVTVVEDPLPLQLAKPSAAEPPTVELETAEPETTEPALFERPARAVPHPTRVGRSTAPATAEDKEDRARIPSWDDILLGVRRKRD